MNFGDITNRLKALREEMEGAGFSEASTAGQLYKSAERREFESLPTEAQLQAELKRALSQEGSATNRAKIEFDIQEKRNRRRELAKKFDKSVVLAKVRHFVEKLGIVKHDYEALLHLREQGITVAKEIAAVAEKMNQRRNSLRSRAQEIEDRRRRLQTESDARSWIDETEHFRGEVKAFQAEEESLESKAHGVQEKYSGVAAVPSQTILRINTEMSLLEKSLNQVSRGR